MSLGVFVRAPLDERARKGAVLTARRGLALLIVLALCGLAAFRFVAGSPDASAKRAGTAEAGPRPNIVFVLTDDLSWNLVKKRYMPHVIGLKRRGITFNRYVVADSLCCPSRTSIFTGLFPHDSGVFANTGSDGGYGAFLKQGNEDKSYAIPLRSQRYRTAMMGKYLNGYEPTMRRLPRGWSDWIGAGDAYSEFGYDLNVNGSVVHYGHGPPPPSHAARYLTDVLARKATAFINRSSQAHKPFVMEVATFAPHAPYTPAPRNSHDFPGLKAPRTAAFNKNNFDPPLWLGVRPPLTSKQLHTINRGFRKRAQSVEAVDRMIGSIEDTLRARGLADNTYIVFSSDNGYHMGEHRLLPGKMTAFDTDIRVPLIVVGPGVPHNRVDPHVVQNVDLNPTFAELAGGTPRETADGHSIVPLLHPSRGKRSLLPWRTAALIEHHGPDTYVGDPDLENGRLSGNPTSYEAVRLANGPWGDAVYVEYSDPAQEREFYDIDSDPSERFNIYYTGLTASDRIKLHAIAVGLSDCHGMSACWTAGQPR
jgi:N-acetylglucosamine-6-sulfatase